MPPPASITLHPANSVLQGEDGMLLLQRVEQMERSINRILPIVRKILYAVSERQGAGEGGLPDNHGITH